MSQEAQHRPQMAFTHTLASHFGQSGPMECALRNNWKEAYEGYCDLKCDSWDIIIKWEGPRAKILKKGDIRDL